MVIIKEKFSENKVFLPKNTSISDKTLFFRLRSLATLSEFQFEVEDIGELSDYYTIEFDFDTFNDGEYEYAIGDDKGLLIIGDYKEERKETNETYNNKVITYKQYNG